MSEPDDILRQELDDAYARFLKASDDQDAVGPFPGFEAAVLPLLAERKADKFCIEADQIHISYLNARLEAAEAELRRTRREASPSPPSQPDPAGSSEGER